MALNREAVLAEIDGVLDRCGASAGHAPLAATFESATDAWLAANATACLALLDRLAGPESSYRRAAQKKLDEKFPLANSYTLAHFIGVVLAFRADIEAGYTRTLAELVHADVFADFIEMAEELLGRGYKMRLP